MTATTVLSVASEAFPLAKTGGLGDVAGALPPALAAEGFAVRTLMPAYPEALRMLRDAQTVLQRPSLFGGAARVLAGRVGELDVLLLDAPHLFDRGGGLYVDTSGKEWPDNAQRFAALSQVAADLAQGAAPGFLPEIVHAHDWQAGLVAAYLRYRGGRRPASVFTVHNLSFQGHFPAALLPTLGLPPEAMAMDGIEYFGGIGYLKAGLAIADHITTVSPRYAMEIRTPEFGMGLEGLLTHRASALSGILNGIDTGLWDPQADAALATRFSAETLERRAENKAALQARLGLVKDPRALLFGVVSRLTWQKGTDLLLAALPDLLRIGGQLALVGSGEAELEAGVRVAQATNPGRVGAFIGFDESLAHLVQGGVDALLVPSRFEPCGLTQLCALRYGALPIVSRVGGLADTVSDANEMDLVPTAGNGFQFGPVTREALAIAIERAATVWHEPERWRRLQRHAMAADVSWRKPARAYAALFRSLLAARGG